MNRAVASLVGDVLLIGISTAFGYWLVGLTGAVPNISILLGVATVTRLAHLRFGDRTLKG